MKILIAIIVLAYLCSGCCSYMVLEHSKSEIRQIREQRAREIKADNNGARIAFDVTNLEAIKQHPIMQFVAGALDLAIGYGLKEGVESLNDDKSDSATINVTGNGNTTTYNTGDFNEIGNPDYSEENSGS